MATLEELEYSYRNELAKLSPIPNNKYTYPFYISIFIIAVCIIFLLVTISMKDMQLWRILIGSFAILIGISLLTTAVGHYTIIRQHRLWRIQQVTKTNYNL
jgi:uncharacterized BrkB/YihY/UPF0761 family membrane protein